MRILIVEDLEVSRKLLRLTLQAEGHSVIDSADGVEALNILKTQIPAVVISDILMPNMDGYRLLTEIRQDERLKDLPVIMYSSTYNSPTDKKLSIEMGANAFLPKPSPANVLNDTILKVTAEKGKASISSFALSSADVVKPYSQRLVQLLEDRNEKLIKRTADLEESEEKFRQFAENIQDVLWITNADQSEMVYISPAYEQIWGRSCQSLYDNPLSWQESVYPDDRPRTQSDADPKLLGTAASEFEYRIVRPDGSLRWINVKSFPVKNAAGVIYRVAGIASDITERKKKEEQLKEAAKLSALAADVGAALTQGDRLRSLLYECAAAVVTHLDAAFARIWTHNEETATLELQASAGMYTHLDGPHGRVPVGKFKIGKIASERKPHLTNAVQDDPLVPEQEWARREGLISFAGYPLVVDHKLIGVIAMFARHALTDAALNAMAAIANGIALGIQRKQAETEVRRQHEELQFILDAVPALVFYKDREGRFVRVNRELARIVGAPPEAFVGKTDMEMDSLNGERYREDDLRVMTSGQPLRHVEEPLHTAGGIRWLLTDKVPHRDETDRIVGVIGFAVDITERKHAEQRVAWLASFPERNPNPIMELDLATGLVNYANPAANRAFPELKNQGFAHPSLAGLREAGQTLTDKTAGVVIREILVGKNSYLQTINYIPETNRLRVYWSDITSRKQIEEALRKSEDQ